MLREVLLTWDKGCTGGLINRGDVLFESSFKEIRSF